MREKRENLLRIKRHMPDITNECHPSIDHTTIKVILWIDHQTRLWIRIDTQNNRIINQNMNNAILINRHIAIIIMKDKIKMIDQGEITMIVIISLKQHQEAIVSLLIDIAMMICTKVMTALATVRVIIVIETIMMGILHKLFQTETMIDQDLILFIKILTEIIIKVPPDLVAVATTTIMTHPVEIGQVIIMFFIVVIIMIISMV